MTSVVNSRITNLLVYILVLVVNATGFTGGLEPRDPSLLGSHPSLLVPARYAFAAWLPIHVTMLLFSIYQILPFTYNLGFINYGITPLFWIHSVCNISWSILNRVGKLPQYEHLAWIRIIFMMGMIFPLLLSYFRTTNRIAIDILNRTNSNKNFYLNYWFGRVWLSIYTAWMLYASSMDLFAVLDVSPTYAGYFAAKLWVLFLTAIVLVIVRTFQDVVFGAVFTWIMYWLCVKHNQADSSDPSLQLYRVAIVSGSAISLLTFIALLRNINFCVMRYKAHALGSPFTREEATPINPQDFPTTSYMA